MANKEVAQASSGEVLVLDDDLLSGGTGLEDTDAGDYAIPFVRVLQSGSPQLKKNHAKYIEGAAQGMMFNTVTNQVYDGDEGLLVVPCAYVKKYIEWVPRDSGGGIVNSDHSVDILKECTQNEKKKYTLNNGNEVQETAQYFALIVNSEEEPEEALLSFTSSQLNFSRRWNSMLRTARVKNSAGDLVLAPMFANVYRIKTVEQSNDLGSWYGFTAEKEKGTPMPIARLAREFMTAARSGDVKVKQESAVDDDTVVAGDDIPF
tara:strand:+ start:458 stop:1243 length:786 start_codon:yes stop_codon:yes gene_type:complete